MDETINSIREYSYSDDAGDAQAIVYHLFPGVEVAYTSVHMADFDFGLFEQGERKNYVSIHYCAEGRIEQQVNDEFFYLMPGDCSFAIHKKPQKLFQFPLKHYHGVSICIDLDCMRSPLMAYAESCDCAPLDVLHHICSGMSHIVLRSSDAAKKYFNDLYEAGSDVPVLFICHPRQLLLARSVFLNLYVTLAPLPL